MLPEEYGCVVANRFGNLLDDHVDPFDLLNAAETEKDMKKKKKKQEDEKKNRQKKPGQKESQRDRRVPVSSEAPETAQARKLQSRGPMTEKVEKEESHRASKRAANVENIPQEFSVPRPSSEDREVHVRGGFRGGRRGGGGGRGGFMRNPDNFNMRGKREYDRHNGTGISPEEKRGGRGPWNWGSVDEAACELMEVTETANVKSEEPQTSADEGNPTMVEEGDLVVHVAVEMSLDEWKALQEMNRPKVEFNIRKAENKIPSKAKVIHKSKHLENLKNSLEDVDEENTFLRRSVNDITSLMDINFGSLGRPSRGGRGRGGPRGAMRGGATIQPEKMKSVPEMGHVFAPDPYDPEDFPALSAGQ